MRERSRIIAAVGALAVAGSCLIVLGVLPGTIELAAGAEFAYPPGAAGVIAADYIETFSTGKDSLLTAFFESYLSERAAEMQPVKTRVWECHRLYSLFGVLAPQELIENDESLLVLRVKSEKVGTWFQVSFEMDVDAPGKLLDVDFEPAARSE
jgi:hypothetical protein